MITGITTFWCSAFILPKACIKRINSLCGVFLWKRDIEEHHSARVSWEVVTRPKKEGGLGIKNLAIWNNACCLKLIWLLFFQTGSVWVAWFIEEILDGSLSNLWIKAPSRRYSWQVNKLLKLSSLIFGFIKLRVQNGLTARFWTDNWTPFGALRSYFASSDVSSLGISADATVASLFIHGNWIIPPARSEAQVNIHALLTMIELNENADYYEWEVDGCISQRYSACLVYGKLCEAGISVTWYRSVWNRSGIPRHSFLAWLFVLNRCPTRDGILGWGLQTDPSCVLCNLAAESRDHLFFDCGFAWHLWETCSMRCGFILERLWGRVLEQLQALNQKSATSTLLRICWQGCLYRTWTERNARIHRRIFTSPDSIFRLLDRQIRNRILSLRDQNPALSSSLMQTWLS